MSRLISRTHGREAPPTGGLGRIARLLLVATPFLLALSTPAALKAQTEAGRNRAQAARCPSISLCCHASVRRGLLGPFTATLVGTSGVTPVFNWKVSAGQVAAGQGTSGILVDTKGLKGGAVLVTLEVGGYGPRCSATCVTELPPAREPPPPLAALNVFVKNALNGRPVPRALVKVYRPDGAIGHQDETDAGGRFMSGGWTPGAYHVEVSAHRFRGRRFDVTLDPYSTGFVALSLRPAAAPTPSPTPAATPTPEAVAQTTPTPDPPTPTPVVITTEGRGLFWLLLAAAATGLGITGYLLANKLAGAAHVASLAGAEQSLAAAAGATKQADEVHCTAYAPPSAQPDDEVLVQVFVHLEGQADRLEALATCSDADTLRRDSQKLSRTIERGRELFLTLQMRGLEIDEPTKSVVWDGEVERVCYDVVVPADFKPKKLNSKVVVAVADEEGNRVPVAHLMFSFEVTAEGAPPPAPAAPAEGQKFVTHRFAFISYASENRPEVAKRVQMLRAQGIECFWDVLTLKQGEQWESSIYQFIDRSDVFYLFWSEAAKNSPWVVREVAYALCQKAVNAALPVIMPIAVESPIAPPPVYLEELHFNDATLFFMKPEEAAPRPPARV